MTTKVIHLRDTLSDALKFHDENGVRPTDTELEVLTAIIATTETVNEKHDDPSTIPSERDYAAAIVTMLERKYFTPKGAWG